MYYDLSPYLCTSAAQLTTQNPLITILNSWCLFFLMLVHDFRCNVLNSRLTQTQGSLLNYRETRRNGKSLWAQEFAVMFLWMLWSKTPHYFPTGRYLKFSTKLGERAGWISQKDPEDCFKKRFLVSIAGLKPEDWGIVRVEEWVFQHRKRQVSIRS